MPKKIKLLATALILTLFCFASTVACASSFFDLFSTKKPAPPKPIVHISKNTDDSKAPTHVKVGVYILHIGKYDPQRATIQMDFYLMFNCNPSCDPLNFEITNAVSPNIILAEKKKNYLAYRIQTELNKADNLRNYPFDSHRIDIILEDKQLTIDKIVFEPDNISTEFDNNIDVVGFHLLPTWTAEVTNHFYGVFKRTFSSYKFSMYLKRPFLAGTLKGILPALIIVCCAFLALFMKIEHISQRFSIATSTLIASVVFHLNLTSSLPSLGYVTYADMFMLVNYLCLFIVLIEVVVTTYCIDAPYHDLAVRVNRLCSRLVPTIWLLLQLTIWFTFSPTQIVQGG